ncbi:methyl-accepting chemotaxis protein [Dechloromonas denitrificans]|uniref:methyl-accepting chemotaxis protein n=1 Tax=Dechloromonas denitrificans TaxID=281362 RepID=UPI001CF87ECC|nr:methyl-accepting chemotaxis protein [Dechloromonas denitrificans]UCV04819.1 methyl-accepting chemotaxis protein [Dechloromonas denitrificans]
MFSMSIRGRLIALVTFLAAALIVTGSISFYIARSAEAEIESIFKHEAVPMRELARIRRLVVENSGQIFRAMQHNPGTDYAKLHDHPVSAHLEVIEKNLKWMDETFVSFKANLLPDSEELKLFQEFEPLYARYASEVVQPTMTALVNSDYSAATVAHFLKANAQFEAKINPLMRSIAEAQEKAVKASYETSTVQNRRFIWISVVTLGLGLLIGLLIAVHTIRSITLPLDEMQALITRAARDKDFTGSIRIRSRDEVGLTAEAFNDLLKALQQSLGAVRHEIIKVDEATATLSQAASQAAQASAATSESSSSMAASLEELSVSITSVSDHTREALALANQAGEHSETGGSVIGSAVSAMAAIAVEVRSVGATISELGQHSDRISSVVQVIKDVADQTNLLALNAAIEAARAGEQGRGFAVVADEVRKLAERTSKATGEIGGMIGDIQSRSKSAVLAMDGAISRLENGSELANRAGQAIAAIRSANSEVQRVFADIDEAMHEQGAASYDIAQKVEQVAQASEESSVSVGISASEAANIRDLTNSMRATVERFKI